MKVYQLKEDVNWGLRGERPIVVLGTYSSKEKANAAKKAAYENKGYREKDMSGKFFIMAYEVE